MYGLLTKCAVKMAGYWLSSCFFFCVFMDQDRVVVHKLAKQELSQYPRIWKQAWSIKDLLYDFQGNFWCGFQWVPVSG